MNPVIRETLILIGIVGSALLYFIFASNHGLGIVLLFYSYPAYLLIRLLIWSIMALIRYYRKLKIEQKPLLNKNTLSIGVYIIAAVLILVGYDYMKATGPTAIVIDAETGKPVEGAVALAQWRRAAGGSIFEGGSEALDKAKESFSGKDGLVHIDGFWGLYIFSWKPSLTVYKPGYVLWDSRWLCPTSEKRTEFDENNRTVKLLKFDNEAARWLKENYDVGRGVPRAMQESFFDRCYSTEIPNIIKFRDIFYLNEVPLIKKEKMENKKAK